MRQVHLFELRARLKRAGLVAAAVIASGLIAWHLTPDDPRLDDALISLDSAVSLISGGDGQYGVPPLVGVTSPPYVLLIVAILRLGVSPIAALKLATSLGLLALALAVWGLARALKVRGRARFAVVAAVLSPVAVIEQATNGVETGWAMAVAVTLIAAVAARRMRLAGAAAGLLPWLRPDLALLAAALMAAALWKETWKTRALTGAAAMLAAAPWAIWLVVQTDAWIPQTIAAKAMFFAEGCQPLSFKLPLAAGALGAWSIAVLPAALVAAVWLPDTRLGKIGLAASAVAIAVHAELLPGGLWHNDGRYLHAILVPWLAFGVAVGMQRGGALTRGAVAAAIAANLALWFARDTTRDAEAAERVAMGRWTSANVEADARLLVHDAGMFAVFTTNPLVDLVGLKTPASIDVHRQHTWPSCGERRADAVAAIARQSGAEFVVLTAEWDALFLLSQGLMTSGLILDPVGTPHSGYKLYKVRRAAGLQESGQ